MDYYSIPFVLLVLLSTIIFWSLQGQYRKWRIGVLLFSSVVFLGDNLSALIFVVVSGLANAWALRWVLKEAKRIPWAVVAIIVNLLLLLLYKLSGASWSHWGGDWVMPLGLSFYTFQHIASWVKVRQEDWDETPSILDYLIYTMYFPKLISGPVEKWESFQGQLAQLGNLELDTKKMSQGLRYILWGAFAKWTIAPLVHSFYLMLWTDTPSFFGFLLAGVFNFIYIYADFSGYSNFVIGISLLMGITLIQNFKFPFFTNQVRNFWQRWHISFTQWILDYLFTPLTFYLRSWGKKGIVLAIIVSFLVVGIWHGLETQYIAFGLVQGLYFLPILLKWNWSEQLAQAKKKSMWLDQAMIIPFFLLMSTTALIFSSSSWFDFVAHLMHVNGMMNDVGVVFSGMSNLVFLLLIIGFFAIEWWNRLRDFGLDIAHHMSAIRWSLYLLLIVALITWGEFKNIGTLYAHF